MCPEPTRGGVPRPTDAEMASELRKALLQGGLSVVYQPKLNLRSGEIDAIEALCRWHHAIYGPIAPDRFIKLAEATGDIEVLTRLVIAAVLQAQAELSDAVGKRLTVYVNISGGLITNPVFIDWIMELCRQRVGALGLEITETAVISDPDAAIAQLNRLNNMGVPISIDDYGTGLSSLTYLRMLPACSLKIDRLFISNMKSSPRDPLIVRSTVDLAHALEMSVTAEGVEDAATLALLTLMGCDRAQGFHISAPLAFFDALAYLRSAAASPVSLAPRAVPTLLRHAS